MSIAIFASLPTGLDLAVQLVGETIPNSWGLGEHKCPSSIEPRKALAATELLSGQSGRAGSRALLSGENSVLQYPGRV